MDISISLGSNIEPFANIKIAEDNISENFTILKSSNLYLSDAEGFEGNSFINQVILCETQLPYMDVIQLLKKIEKKLGRRKTKEKYSDRKIDLDLLTYGDLVFKDDRYEIPHKDIEKYSFVLVPLVEVMPDKIHPKLQLSFKNLLAKKSNFSEKVKKLD